MKRDKRLIIMDVIIAVLVVLNAAVIIAYVEDGNGYNRLWSSYRIMGCYRNDEYGNAVDYTSRNGFVLDDNDKTDKKYKDLYESMAVADYYKARFYENVYVTSGNAAKEDEMSGLADDAVKRMGSLEPLKKRIDNMIK